MVEHSPKILASEEKATTTTIVNATSSRALHIVSGRLLATDCCTCRQCLKCARATRRQQWVNNFSPQSLWSVLRVHTCYTLYTSHCGHLLYIVVRC